MPLHTGFHPICAGAFCPIYDTARQNFASKVRRSSWVKKEASESENCVSNGVHNF